MKEIWLISIPKYLCVAAALLYLIRWQKFKGWERLVPLVIFLNVLADQWASQIDGTNGYVYNILAPIERILTLVIYIKNSRYKNDVVINIGGIAIVLLMSIFGLFYYPSFKVLHSTIYVVSGLMMALLSYLHLRSIVLDTAGQSFLTLVFSFANLVYFTLMVSGVSAYEFANLVDPSFAKNIYSANLIAYGLWSVILIIGTLWKRQKI